MDDYFAEAEEHLTAVRRGLLILETAVGGGDLPAAIVEELFRSFHSLKGTSAMVELGEAERLAHEMESCLGSFRDHRFVLTAAGVRGARRRRRHAGARHRRAARADRDPAGRRADRPPGRGVRTRARPLSTAATASPVAADSSAGAPAPEGSLWKVTFTPSPDLVARGVKVDTIRERLSDLGRIESVAPRVTTSGGISFEFQVDDAGRAGAGILARRWHHLRARAARRRRRVPANRPMRAGISVPRTRRRR